MGLKFKPGDAVRQVVPVISGVVSEAQVVEGEIHYKVDWTGPDGTTVSKYFDEAQIELVTPLLTT